MLYIQKLIFKKGIFSHMKIRSFFLTVISAVIFICFFPLCAGAEEFTVEAPVLGYTLTDSKEVRLYWDYIEGAEFYLCRYDKENDDIISEIRVGGNSEILTDLTPDTVYSYFIKAVSVTPEGTVCTGYSDIIEFKVSSAEISPDRPKPDFIMKFIAHMIHAADIISFL